MSLSTLADRYCPSVCRPVLERVQNSPIGKRIVSGTFWSVLGNGFGKVFTFIAMVLVARILGKEAFGEFGLVHSTAMTFVAFSSFGMGITATKYIAEFLHTDKERTERIIGLTYVFTFLTSLLVAIVFYLISPWLCETQLGKPELTNVMRLGSILLFLMTFMGTQTAVMAGFQDFYRLAMSTIIVGILSLPIYVVGCYWYGIMGAVVAAILCATLNVVINSLFIFQNTNKYQICWQFFSVCKELSILKNSNIPIVLNSITYAFSVWICLMWLGMQNQGYSELGAYFAVFAIITMLNFIPQNIFITTFPILNTINCHFDVRYFRRVILKILIIILSVTIIVITPILIFVTPILSLFGDKFINTESILFFACISLLFSNISAVVNQVFYSQSRCWECFFYSLIYLGIYCCLVAILLQKDYGASSIFLARIIADIIYTSCTCVILNNTIQ